MKSQNSNLIAVPWGPDVVNPLRNTKQLYLKFLNSGVFSEDGRRFLRYGYYTDAPKGTLDYKKYWDEQWNRCINGYTVGGVRVSGRHYFYLNFSPIKARPVDPVTGLENITARKKWTLPRFLDHSYYFFNELEDCMAEGPSINNARQGMVVLKSRRKGFTYQISSGAFAYNFVFLPHSMSLLAAYEKAHYKVTLDGIHSVINHINKHTPWVRRREVLSQREHFRASFKEMKDNVEVEEGYLSEIHAVSFKDNPFKGIGECLAKGTGILMSDGRTKLVEEIVPGDSVMGIDSTPRNVLSVHNGMDNMYKIIPAKGDSFIVNSKHKHYLYDEYAGEYTVKTTEELLNKTKWQHARYKLCLSDRLEFSTTPIQLDPYMMGVWLGDGHSNSFSITTMDKEIRDAVYDIAKEYRCSVRVSSNGSRALTYHLNSESALKYNVSNNNETIYFQSANAVSKYFHTDRGNIYKGRRIVKGGYAITKTNTPNDALNYYNVKQNKHIPDDYLYNSVDNRLKLLAGIIDTDGCLVNDKSYYEIHQKDKVFAEQILYLCRSLGFYSKISVKTKKVGDKVFKGYRITLTGNIWEIPVRIERKKASKRKSWINNHLRTTFKVESCGKSEYYGFELDKDHLFIMDNFFITHNSLDLAGFEEAGKFEGLLEALAITEPTYRDGDIMTGVPLVWGTGGDIEAGGLALGEFFYNPKAYGFKRYENIYDENATGECGWFVDDLWYLPGEAHIAGKPIYMVDAQGNSIRSAAYETLMKKRDVKKQGDPRAYKTFITQQPLTPKEALMRTDGDFFDVVSAQDRLSQIETNPKIYINTIFVGRMSMDDTGAVLWKPSDDAQPVREFPIRDNKGKPGAIEIFEHPSKNESGNIPTGLYIAGIDPYDDDESTTDSLGSTLIMNLATDRIVAEYTGRPATAYMYYENVRRLLMYYNATAMYENAKKGLFTYFDRMNCTYLLADTPKFLKDIELVKTVAAGNSLKGYYPSTNVNAFGRGLIRNWSTTQATGHPDGVNNMMVIRSIGLLKELINYNSKGNFDRVSAAIALMLLREEIGRYVTADILSAKVELKKDDKFFNKNYGTKSWQNQILFGNR